MVFYYFVFGVYVVYLIVYVCTVGIIVAFVLLACCTSGFCPPYYRIYYCCCLIFDFWANIFIMALPWDKDFFRVSSLGVFVYCSSICRCRISSSDSFISERRSSYVRSWGSNVC